MRKISNVELTLEECLDYEKSRYQKKGYGIIFAAIFTISWFVVLPKLACFIWPYKVEDQGVFFFLLSYVLHEVIFLFMNFMMWVIYKLEWSFFERYKVHDKPWPWKEDPEKWNKLLKETIWILFINQVIILPFVSIYYYYVNIAPYRVDFESLPSCFEVVWQTVFFMIMDDFAFYWGHRFLHWDRIYPYIHKMHHKYANTVSIASEFAHPFEYLFVNVLNANLGPLILGQRAHLFTFGMWIVLRIAETTDGHCGYEFSWSPYRLLPMSGSSEYHNYHHISFKGNYGSFFTYMDRIFGTVGVKYAEFVKRKQDYTEKTNTKSSHKKLN